MLKSTLCKSNLFCFFIFLCSPQISFGGKTRCSSLSDGQWAESGEHRAKMSPVANCRFCRAAIGREVLCCLCCDARLSKTITPVIQASQEDDEPAAAMSTICTFCPCKAKDCVKVICCQFCFAAGREKTTELCDHETCCSCRHVADLCSDCIKEGPA